MAPLTLGDSEEGDGSNGAEEEGLPGMQGQALQLSFDLAPCIGRAGQVAVWICQAGML